MIEGFNIGDRARMAHTNTHASYLTEHGNGHVPQRKPPRKPSRLIAKAVCRLGGAMVRVGRRLECYEASLLSEAERMWPLEAQIK